MNNISNFLDYIFDITIFLTRSKKLVSRQNHCEQTCEKWQTV